MPLTNNKITTFLLSSSIRVAESAAETDLKAGGRAERAERKR